MTAFLLLPAEESLPCFTRACFAAHVAGGARAVDQTFEQGIARQAVGAVDPGAGSFAGGIKSGKRGAAAEIGANASHRIMRRRTDRHQVRGKIDVVLQAGGVNARESLLQAFAIQVGKVKIDDRLARRRNFQLVGNGAGDDIARSQLRHIVVLRHEAAEIRIAQISAFAAQRLGEQKARRVFQIKSCRMELNEFHVADFGARPKGHGNAIARSDPGVRGIGIDLAHAAGGQHDGCRPDLFLFTVLVQQMNADDAAVFHPEAGGKAEFTK